MSDQVNQEPEANDDERYVSRTHSADEQIEETDNSQETSETPETKNISNTEEQKVEQKEQPTELQALKQQIEQLTKQFAASQSFIGKQSSEIGNLRKQLKAKETPTDPKKFLAEFVENPSQAIEQEMARREQQKQESAEMEANTYQSNLATVTSVVPNIDALIPQMIEELKADGIQNPSVEMIKASIQTEPHLVINYAKRAAYRQQMTQVEQKGKQIIEKVANGSKKVTPTSGKSLPPQKEMSIPRNLRSLSDEELAALYSKTKNR